jgi:hypothetical protein
MKHQGRGTEPADPLNAAIAPRFRVTSHWSGGSDPWRSIRMNDRASEGSGRFGPARGEPVTAAASTAGRIDGRGLGAPRISRISTDIRRLVGRVSSVPSVVKTQTVRVAAGKAGIASQLTSERLWPGLPDRGRWVQNGRI